MEQGNSRQADLELAYAAGYFDGEGSFVAYPYVRNGRIHQKHYKAVITATYLPTLDYLVEAYGGSIHEYTGQGLGEKQCYNWHCTGQNAYEFIKAVLPYLREKQDHARFMLTIWEQRSNSEAFVLLCEERKQRWGRAAAETKREGTHNE